MRRLALRATKVALDAALIIGITLFVWWAIFKWLPIEWIALIMMVGCICATVTVMNRLVRRWVPWLDT